jgi:hypothetical protein
MLRVDVLQRKSLFSFLHAIDVDLAESIRQKSCPTAEGHCIAPPTNASPAAVLRMSPMITRSA